MIIVGDVAGQYESLVRLLAKCPDEETIFVGDLVDRGPDSNKVVDFVMNHKKAKSLMGNHEHMMLDYYDKTGHYDEGLWFLNGGGATDASYKGEPPKEHLDFLRSLPIYMETTCCFISHAPRFPYYELEDIINPLQTGRMNTKEVNPHSLLWARSNPKQMEKFQFYGHNSFTGLHVHKTEESDIPFAMCLDDSNRKVLTAVHVIERDGSVNLQNIYQEAY